MMATYCSLSIIFVVLLNVPLFLTAEGVALERMKEEAVAEATMKNKFVVILYHPDPCQVDECKNVDIQLPLVAASTTLPDLRIIFVANAEFTNKLGMNSEPKLVFYRNGVAMLYDASPIKSDEVLAWLDYNAESFVHPLDDDSFENETQAATGSTTGDWFIRFYRPECNEIAPLWETVASRLNGRVVVASIDLSVNPNLQKRFKIEDCSAIFFFRNGNMYTYELSEKTVQQFVAFAQGWYSNAPSKPVPGVEQFSFDELVEKIADNLKDTVGPYPYVLYGITAVIVILLLWLVKRCCCRRRKQKLF